MIEATPTGVYITERGVAVEKKPIFITEPEWLMLWELSHEARKPIGNLIVSLARAERSRLKAGTE
jgi:hypothetical protein